MKMQMVNTTPGYGDTLRGAFDIINNNFFEISKLIRDLNLKLIEPSMTLREATELANYNFAKIEAELTVKKIRKAKLDKINENL